MTDEGFQMNLVSCLGPIASKPTIDCFVHTIHLSRLTILNVVCSALALLRAASTVELFVRSSDELMLHASEWMTKNVMKARISGLLYFVVSALANKFRSVGKKE